MRQAKGHIQGLARVARFDHPRVVSWAQRPRAARMGRNPKPARAINRWPAKTVVTTKVA